MSKRSKILLLSSSSKKVQKGSTSRSLTQKKIYEDLSRRHIRSTRFFDGETCATLGILEDILDMADSLGWDEFLNITIPPQFTNRPDLPPRPPCTYQELTLQFLSSFQLQTTERNGVKELEMQFKIFNKRRRLTVSELNAMFGWNPENPVQRVGDVQCEGLDEQAWWKRITLGVSEYTSNLAKASEIIHPSLRYFHRMMVYSIFSRQELGQVKQEELKLLWLANDGYLNYDNKINYGAILAKRFHETKLGTTRNGDIQCGGMITWIAYKLGFEEELAKLIPVNEFPFLNLSALKQAGMFRLEGDTGRRIWMVREFSWCYIPNPFISYPPDNVNPWRVPRADIPEREWDEPFLRQQHHQQQQQHHQQQQELQYAQSPSFSKGDMPSSSSSFDFKNALQNLSLQVSQMAENSAGYGTYNAIYDWQVNQGHFAPPVNYPYWPPQQGPVPSWEDPPIDESPRRPTYPYWQGLSSQIREPRHFGETYDYRAPGGCDFRGDPNYPYFGLGFPPGYYGGWEPHGPPCEVAYNWRPEPHDSK